MEEGKALAQFVADDERRARQAYDCLTAQARPYLRAYLARTTRLSAEQREDVVQETLLRFWSVRTAYENTGVPAWHGWLKVTARHCCVDLYRRTHDVVAVDNHPNDKLSVEIAEKIAEKQLNDLMDALEARTIQHHADVLWLGLNAALESDVHTRRLLAAQLLYLDKLPWHTVCRLVGSARPGEPPLTREELDQWLADDGVLRHLAYHTLRYDNDRLAAFLLGLPDPSESATLDALARNPAALPALAHTPDSQVSWSPAEVSVILWRYRHTMLFDQILQREDCTLTPAALMSLIDRTLACFPFSEEMTSLLAALGARGRHALIHRGVWQRLAFAYRYQDGLPHQDIRDRTQPAYRYVADPSQPEITLGMLNVWLSNGRLLKTLARACRVAGEIRDDEIEVGHV